MIFAKPLPLLCPGVVYGGVGSVASSSRRVNDWTCATILRRHSCRRVDSGISFFQQQRKTRLFASSGDSATPDESPGGRKSFLDNLLQNFTPPKWLYRSIAAGILGGQTVLRIATGKIHVRNTLEQLDVVGPKTLGVALLTAGFVGMVFTIQFVREFAKLGLTRSVGGVLALALSRELTPVVTSIILAGRVGSAFAAELGTMQVSEQTDSLRVLATDPVDYLVTPRVLACMIAGPILNILCFCMGMGASVFLAEAVYDVSANIILDSAARAITSWDVISSMIKSWVFGGIIAIVSCSWGFTTTGGAKGVGESTTSAVVISLVCIFIADFFLSFAFFQGQGDALKQCM
ncbi:hypothetical protein BSKO_08089 [Bryopsis sp. KO-2023]|nr:hypothetical protein BSKO_08089 [Bryopsis sp. KO-2023]